VKERGTNGNTLLNLAVSIESKVSRNGGEILNAVTSRVNLATIHALLKAGADANQANNRGGTPLHQAAYSNQPDIATILIHHGAAPDSEDHTAGGTPLVTALFWGATEAAMPMSAERTTSSGETAEKLSRTAGLR
jgi:ankyrin repeat protein